METSKQNPNELWAEIETLRRRIAALEQAAGVEGEEDYVLSFRKSVFDAAISPLAISDLQGRIFYVNPALFHLWGYQSASPLLGKPVFSLWKNGSSEDEVLGELARRGGWSGKKDALRADGTICPVQVYAGLTGTGEKRDGAYVFFFADRSDQERLIAQLILSEKMASIGHLAAGLAHQINNPASYVMTNLDQISRYLVSLTALVEAVEELIGGTGDEKLRAALAALERKHDLEYIRSDLEAVVSESLEGMMRIRNIVADLRKFADWDEEEAGEIDVNAMVESVLNLAASEIRFRGRLEKKLNPVPHLSGIQGRLANALLNIVVNAAQALDESRAAVNLIIVSTGIEGSRIYIQVEDTGRGIPPEDLRHIFEPFFSTKPAAQGKGLGLSLALEVVRKMGGEITVQSQAGVGSVFTLWLPLETEKAGPPAGEEGVEPLRRLRLMVIDDEEAVLLSFQRMLGREWDLTLLDSADKALTHLEKEHDYDVILCDLVMPGHNGEYVYREAVQRWPKLERRFLFFTGGVYPESLKEFGRQMKERIIYKPQEADKIRQKLLQYLEKIR